MSEKKSRKNLKFTSLAWAFAAMLLAVVILINVAASFFDAKIDMTPNKIYTMSDTSREFFESLDKEVDLYLLYDLDEIENSEDAGEVKELTSFLKACDEFDKVTLHDIDPDKNPDLMEELNPDNQFTLKDGDIIVKCGDSVKRVFGSEMNYYTYSDTPDANGQYIATSKTFMGEGIITGAVKSLTDGYAPTIYFLTGHGEKSLTEDYTLLSKKLKNYNYTTKELDLSSGNTVPEDAAIIVVAAPQQDISADEKDKINDFMDNGGNLSLLMSPTNNGTDFDNLVDIMHDYCIGMDYTRVYETDSAKHMSNDKYKIATDLVKINLDEENTGSDYDMNNLSGGSSSDKTSDELKNMIESINSLINDTANLACYLPESRSFFQYAGDNISTVTLCPLLMASDTAEVEAYGGTESKESSKEIDNINANNELWLGAYSEDPTRNYSKLVVMPNAEFIDDECQKEGYTIPPMNLYLYTISCMSSDSIEMDIPRKTQTLDYMTLATESDTNLMIGIIIAAPVIVAAAGVVIWLRRRHS